MISLYTYSKLNHFGKKKKFFFCTYIQLIFVITFLSAVKYLFVVKNNTQTACAVVNHQKKLTNFGGKKVTN